MVALYILKTRNTYIEGVPYSKVGVGSYYLLKKTEVVFLVATKKAILAVGAHPDDIELGCGATIAKHLEAGDLVFVMIITNGEWGSHTYTRKECLDSLRTLGIKGSHIIFGDFPDGHLSDNRETVEFIEAQINRLNISRVYTHCPMDRHQDHRNCGNAVSAAARKVQEILLFQGQSTHPNFEPHYFVGLSEENFRKKLDALNCYKTQVKKGCVNLRWIRNLAELNGIACRRKYAEAFAVNHIFRGDKYV